MKHIVGLIVAILAATVLASLATAANVAPRVAWSESKAERMLMRDAEIALPASERARLADELRKHSSLFRGLELWALDEGDESAWWTYHNYADRYDDLLRSVERGLRIEAAYCVGSGRVFHGASYRRFDCLATSVLLSIPSVELASNDASAMPAVVAGEDRAVGPLFTQFTVRVTGKSAFTYE
jgi:hypothetical protein